MSEATVEAIKVAKRFGDVIAVNDVSLEIGAGEFFSLLGPSGCGKTTLLRMIAGFEHPSSGKVVVAGKDMSDVPPHKRPVNMVFQSYALFPHLTIFENVAFGLRAKQSVPKDEIAGRVNWALDLVRLKGFADRFPRQVSGGQAQRVALARAVANHPTVLLLDEPLSALDLKIRQEMQEELARLQRELGITFIMVTHDQGEALALSDRMAVFCQGNLEQVGTPEAIYEQPGTRFVADFIGQNNLLDGTVEDLGDRFCRVAVADNLSIWVKKCHNAVAPGSPVVVWVRTEALKLYSDDRPVPAQQSSDEPVNTFQGLITHRSYQGTSTDYRLEFNQQINLKITCPTTAETSFAPGQIVNVCLKASEAAVLGGTTGEVTAQVESTLPA